MRHFLLFSNNTNTTNDLPLIVTGTIIDPIKVLEPIQSMVFGLLWTIIVVLVVIIIIVVLLKVLFAVIAVGPVVLEQNEIQAITIFGQTPKILG
jgi:hypothetical protein